MVRPYHFQVRRRAMEPTYKTKTLAGETIKVLVGEGGREYLSVNRVCQILKLDREALGNRLKGSGVPHQYIVVPTSKGPRSTLALLWDDLPAFLALIETKNPDLRSRVKAWREHLVRRPAQPPPSPPSFPSTTSPVFQDPKAVFLFTMGVLYQRGELPESVVSQVLGAMGSAEVPSLNLPEPPKEAPELPPAPQEPPTVTAAPPEKGEVLTPLKVRPEGYLSAGGVVDLIDSWCSCLPGGSPLQVFAQSGKAKGRTYSRSTLAKLVGKVARMLNIYPLPHEGDNYTPPPENLDNYAVAIPLRQLQVENGETAVREVSHHVVYSPLAVRRMFDYLRGGVTLVECPVL